MIRGSLTADGGSLLFLYMAGMGVASASAMVIHGASRVSPIVFASSGLTEIAAGFWGGRVGRTILKYRMEIRNLWMAIRSLVMYIPNLRMEPVAFSMKKMRGQTKATDGGSTSGWGSGAPRLSCSMAGVDGCESPIRQSVRAKRRPFQAGRSKNSWPFALCCVRFVLTL